MITKSLCFFALLVLCACKPQYWNSPYSSNSLSQSVRYINLGQAPKTLDPARAYFQHEVALLSQIQEPPLEYRYLKLPVVLSPLTLKAMPVIHYFDQRNRQVAYDNQHVVKTVYTFTLKPHIYFQPHPGLNGKRELIAADYVYAIKRLADPVNNSPLFSVLENYIEGFSGLRADIQQHRSMVSKAVWEDLRRYRLKGVCVLDRYQFRITLKGYYPQFTNWLATTFFAPIPWELDKYYANPALVSQGRSFNTEPVGTGPFMLEEYKPNLKLVLTKNPYYRLRRFPGSGDRNDEQKGFLLNRGKQLPLVDKVVYTLEKEAIPLWYKFIQGYYDRLTVGRNQMERTLQLNSSGQFELTDQMESRQLKLQTSFGPNIYYLAFNMIDPVVGGYDQSHQKLRQAIAIASNYEEAVAVLLGGLGKVAHSPIPPGIFGYESGQAGMNPFAYDWIGGKAVKKPLSVAKRLLAEAGYPAGVDPQTGRPLILYYDGVANASGSAQLEFMKKQFAKLGISLQFRLTQLNRYRNKLRTGHVQLYGLGWMADYPDPENFLFLFYGPNATLGGEGENKSNYQNDRFDALFKQMRSMPDGPKRLQVIHQLVYILQHDAVWVGGMIPKMVMLSQPWISSVKLSNFWRSSLQYASVDPVLRAKLIAKRNQPARWGVLVVIFFVLLIVLPVWLANSRQRRQSIVDRFEEKS